MSGCPVHYPESVTEVFPCMLAIGESYRAGTLLDDKSRNVKHLYAIEGAALKAIFGDPDVPPVVGSEPCGFTAPDVQVSSEETAIEILENATPSPGVVESKAIPWPLVWTAVQFLLSKLLK